MDIKQLAIKVVTDGVDKANKDLNELSKNAGKVEGSSNAAGTSLSKLVVPAAVITGVTLLVNKFSELASEGIALAGTYETQTARFKTFTKSIETAKVAMADLTEFANTTPFDNPEIIQAGINLISTGQSAYTLKDTLQQLGDVAAGSGTKIDELAQIFGRARVNQTLYNDDLQRLSDRGIPIYQELGKVMGVNGSLIKDMASKGKVGFQELEKAFKNMSAEGGLFYNAMKDQADGYEAKVSNMNAAMGETKRKMGEELLPSAKGVVEQWTIMVGEGGALGDLLIFLADGCSILVDALKGIILVVNTVYQAFKDFGAAIRDVYDSIAYSDEERTAKAIKNAEKEAAAKKKAAEEAAAAQKKANEEAAAAKAAQQAAEWTKIWFDNIKSVNQIIKSTNTGVAAINDKYDEQIKAVVYLKNHAKMGSEEFINAYKAEDALIKQRSQALEAFNSELKNWEETLNKVSFDKFKESFPLQQAKAFANIMTGIANTSMDALVTGFEDIGKAMADGNVSGKEMIQVFANMAMTILKSLPTLFIQAGLMLIASNPTANLGVGLGLIAAGLTTSLVAGLAEGMTSEESNKSANGNVFGSNGLMKFANGGSFTNSIVDTPTYFKFANGTGLMGEAGPEAIMPLKRNANGVLGVAASGSSGNNVEINIQNNANATVETVTSEEGGKLKLDVIIKNVVGTAVTNGSLDRQLKSRYGLSPRGA